MDEDATDRASIMLENLILAEEGRADGGGSKVTLGGTPESNLLIETLVDTSLPCTPTRRNRIKHDPILNKALMKAVSISDLEGIETALMCGANVAAQAPPFFISALHFAAWLGDQKMVEYLISNGAHPNSADLYGRTPLHLAAAMGYKDCVFLLLEAGADANATTKEIDPTDLIPPGLVSSIAASAKTMKTKGYDFDPYLDGFQMPVLDCGRRTPLHEAVKANSPESVTFILMAGGNPDVVDSRGLEPLLLAGSGVIPQDVEAVSKYEQVVSDLLENGAKATACNPGTGTSALHNAVTLSSVGATIMLLQKKADPGWSSIFGGSTTALHEAAGSANLDILRILLLSEEDSHKRRILSNLEDAIGRTPLHRAAYVGSRSCISFLVEHGANLGLRTKTGVTAMEATFLHVPRSKRFMYNILDSRIRCNSAAAEERGFMLYLDLDILAPDGDNKQTEVLNSIITAKGIYKEIPRSILGHPMVEAFVRLKWHRLRRFFFAVVLIYAVFVVSLSLYITLEFLYPPNTPSRNSEMDRLITATRYIHLLFAFIVLMNVVGQCIAHLRYYARQFETWTNGVSAVLSIMWILALEYSNIAMHSREHKDLIKHFISIAVPLSWAGLMLLLGRFPLWGSHALLFTAVLKNVLWTFVVLGCIVLGFSFSFFVQFHKTHPAAFGNPWRSFIKTMVMMTGEYEYTTIFSAENEESVLQGTSRVTFLIFVVVASIVLVNLIVGLAVSDTQALKNEGQARSLYKRAEFVDLLEGMVAPLARRQALPTKVTLLPNGLPNEKGYELVRHLPPKLMEKLVDIAVMRRDEDMGQTAYDIHHHSWSTEILPRDKGNMENQIFNMLQSFLRDVTLALAPDGLDIQKRLMERSPRLSRFGSQVIRAHRAMKNHDRKTDNNPVPLLRVERPSLTIQC